MLSASTLNVTKLRIVSDATSRLVLAHMDAPALLKKHPFLPIDDTPQERSFGWCAWGDLTDTEWNAATPDIGGICMKCGQRVSEKNFHVDHIVPLAAGGDEWDLNNLELSCPGCNIAKAAKLEV